MVSAAPHFLLHTETHSDPHGGRWRFALRRDSGRLVFEAADTETGLAGPRLELFAAVRGLEALENPARVTLITSSTYVRRGIDYGLQSWRQNQWTWEWFGHMVPVKNRDLWQRVDRALQFHQVRCRCFRIDPPHRMATTSAANSDRPPARAIVIPTAAEIEALARADQRQSSRLWRFRTMQSRRWLAEQVDAWRLKIGQLGTGLLPQPWLE